MQAGASLMMLILCCAVMKQDRETGNTQMWPKVKVKLQPGYMLAHVLNITGNNNFSNVLKKKGAQYKAVMSAHIVAWAECVFRRKKSKP